MTIHLHPVANKAKSLMICRAFAEGAPRGATGHVFYGVTDANVKAWTQARMSSEDWYYIDNSYFDCVRGHQYRVSKNRVQVNPRGKPSDGKRFDRLGLKIEPPVPVGPNVLAIEQSASFMRCVAQDPYWLERELRGLKTFRLRAWSANKIEQATTLHGDLDGTEVLVTHSSAAAVEASLRGIACCVSPMSALCGTYDDRRHQTFSVLADNQWTLEEIKDGRAWHWLQRN